MLYGSHFPLEATRTWNVTKTWDMSIREQGVKYPMTGGKRLRILGGNQTIHHFFIKFIVLLEHQEGEFRFTRSTRGFEKLIQQWYMYARHKVRDSGVLWRCDQRRRCNATITLTPDKTSIIIEGPSDHPSHGPNWGRIHASETTKAIKETQRIADTSPTVNIQLRART
ncbi:hypothetical protein ANN_10749 [Periplaneta americana]|uniref:FLYWCH-type domain-containing protein n=1 Tax=Periplaneta americana TaxID=6978 RepID=A0ABQ8T4U9_PERAM|nr:hypothetical protein ANN_10749 [Periplaneta americana]